MNNCTLAAVLLTLMSDVEGGHIYTFDLDVREITNTNSECKEIIQEQGNTIANFTDVIKAAEKTNKDCKETVIAQKEVVQNVTNALQNQETTIESLKQVNATAESKPKPFILCFLWAIMVVIHGMKY